MREDLARRARRDVIRAAHEGVDWVTMTDLVGAAIRKAVPFGFHCWGPIDPATLLLTGAVARDATAEMDVTEGLGLLPRLEYGSPDVTQWAFLARQRLPVGILSQATHGNPELSPRYRRLLRPQGLERELRGAGQQPRLLGCCRPLPGPAAARLRRPRGPLPGWPVGADRRRPPPLPAAHHATAGGPARRPRAAGARPPWRPRVGHRGGAALDRGARRAPIPTAPADGGPRGRRSRPARRR